jgi:hypothetical protein
MFSCNRKADIPKPTMEQASDGMVLPQEIATLQQAFAASGYSSELKQVNQNKTAMHQWQPQWNASFKAIDAVFVPLLLTDKTLTNFKHFLVIRNGVFSSALYILPKGQTAESVANSPAFIGTFTGKMVLRRLGKKQTHVYIHELGQVLAPSENTTRSGKSTTASKTQGCVTTTTCYWEYTCPNDYRYLSVSVGTDGCKEDPGPVSSVICGTPNPTGSWALWWSDSSTECDPDTPTQGPYLQELQQGWYKITVVRSGLVLGVTGGSLADGAQVVQWYDQGDENQQWYVDFTGWSAPYQAYTFTPRSNYLYWKDVMNGPIGTWTDQKLGIMTTSNNVIIPTTTAGELAKIWTMSTSTASGSPGYTSSPFGWDVIYVDLYNGHRKYLVQNQYSRRYWDILGGGVNAGHNLGQWTLNGGFGDENQHFIFTRLPL